MAAVAYPKDRTKREHVAKVDRVVFGDPAQPFVILALTDGLTAVGNADPDRFDTATVYRFLGRWEDDARRGPRFRFGTYCVHGHHGRAGVVKYLCETVEGIGPKTAGKLWQEYGGGAVEKLRTCPDEAAAACGIDPDSARAFAAELERAARTERTRIDLFDLFDRRGFQGKLIDCCIDRWGAKAPGLVRRNPFALLGLPSAGFKRCDKLWTDLGLPPAAFKRQAVVAAHLVKTDRDGHVWVRADDLAARLRGLVPAASPPRAFKLAIRARLLARHRDAAGVLWLAAYDRAAAEERIVADVRRLTAAAPRWPVDQVQASEADGDGRPSEHQVERLRQATAAAVGLFRGCPGSGKTFTLAHLVKACVAAVGRDRVAICAPTGKAAKRMADGLRLAGVDMPPRTIHGLLEVGRNGHDGDGWGFLRGPDDPLDVDFLFCDECFARGTLVDTDSGPVPIETLGVGSKVVSAAGPDTVCGVSRREAGRVVRVTAGEATFLCSESHPFLTARGWVRARDLGPDDALVPTAAAVRLLRAADLADEIEPGAAAVLRPVLLRELVDAVPGTPGQGLHAGGTPEVGPGAVRVSPLRVARGDRPGGADSPAEPDQRSGDPRQTVEAAEGDRAPAAGPGWERPGADGTAAVASRGTRAGAAAAAGLPDELQVGPRTPGLADRDRGRRGVPQHDGRPAAGRQEGGQAGLTRVDRVEVLEPGHPDLDRHRDADGKLYLYDLAVARHPSFSVSGHLVHNCSMVDAGLMASLLAAVPTGGHVLLIGDEHQLPPVGPGAPFRDLIAAGTATGELTQVRRNAGQIVHACVRIRNGEQFEAADRFDLDAAPPANLRLLPAADDAAIADAVVEVLRRTTKFHPVWQTQVIVARNKGSAVGRRELNDRLQPLLNPDGLAAKGNPFRVGDKVICLRNSRLHVVAPVYPGACDEVRTDAHAYQVVSDPDPWTGRPEPKEQFVANGEVGRVVAVAAGLTVARFSESDDLVKIPVGKDADPDGPDGDREADAGRGCNFDLAYAVTCHKLQGSEAPFVIVVCDESAGGIAGREWWYTAVSRASKACLIVGRHGVVDRQCKRRSLVRRKTFLAERLGEAAHAKAH